MTNLANISFYFFAIFTFLYPYSGFANARSVKVGVYDNSPIVFQDNSGKWQGLSVEILEYVAEKEGWDIEYVFGSFSEGLTRLENAEIDVQVYIAYSKERALKYDYTVEPLLINWGTVYTRPESGIDDILDLEGKRVAMMEDSIHPLELKKLIKNFGINIEEIVVGSHVEGFELVRDRQADAVVVNRVFGLSNAKKYHIEQTHIIFNPIEIRYAMPRGKNNDLIVAIDKHLRDLKSRNNSLYYESFNRAFGLEGSIYHIPRWIFFVSTFLFIILCLMFVANLVLKRILTEKTTKLVESEKKLAKNIAEFKAIFNSITDAIVFVNIDRHIIMTNPAFKLIFDYDFDEVEGKTTEIIYASSEAYSQQGQKRYYKNANTDTPVYEEDYRRKDGSVFTGETLGVPVKDSDGETIGFLGVIRDVTDRKETEKEKIKLEKQLQQSCKMEAIGTLAGGIAHDFNNILGAILGYSEFIQQAVSSDSSIGSDIDNVITSAKRGANLVQQVLTFSRKTSNRKDVLHPHLLVREAIEMLRATLPSSISIEATIDPDCGMVLANPTSIHQIVVNLCTNALHAMHGNRGTLRVYLQRQRLSPAEMDGKTSLPPGDFIVLTVSDTGQGMDSATIKRIFDPYFTTKELGDGTGLGLALVHSIIQDCSGFIDVESSVGDGSTFKVFFPAVKEPASQPVVSVPKDKATRSAGNERILIVDDELLLVKINEKRLQALGYKVTGVTDSIEALSIFRNQPDSFDLLITDQTMPGLTGEKLAKAVLEIKPTIPVIICTGHSDTFSKEEALSMGIKKYTFKPLMGDELLDAVEEVLDNK